MEQLTLCHLILIPNRIKCLLETTCAIQQICTVVVIINLVLLVFLALINFQFLFDLVARPNVFFFICLSSIRNLKSRLVFLLVCSYLVYPIPTAKLIISAEIAMNLHSKHFPIGNLYLPLFLASTPLLRAAIALFLLLKSAKIELNAGLLYTYKDVFEISNKNKLSTLNFSF